MAITRENLKIFKPELLGDSADAGGQRTKNPVVSGELNELFKAISDIDHAVSAVDIVKCFPALDTQGAETLLDGHIFISQPPSDPLVSWLIAESDSLDDESRMTDMVDILESSVRAGQLIRGGLIGLLAGQDSFPRAYLQSMYRYNDRDYWANVTFMQGQVVCISVEYEGNEDARYPRFEHFCEIKQTVTGGQQGQVEFSPPIPYDTPDADLSINGEKGCTKLRLTSQNADIKYHGVTMLTEQNNSTLLRVKNTRSELLPKVKQKAVSAGNTITSDDNADVASGLIYKSITIPSQSDKTTYLYSVPDLLVAPYFENHGVQNIKVIGRYYYLGTLDVTGSTVTVVYPHGGTSGQTIGISWYSSLRYGIYRNDTALPVGKKLTKGSVFATATFTDSNYGTSTLSEFEGGELRESNGQVLAKVDYLTGEVIKFTDARGDFSISYDAIIEDAAVSDNSVTFPLPQTTPILDTFYVTVPSADGNTLFSASADSNGNISGTGISGSIDAGEVSLSFTQAVDLTSLRYDISETVTLNPPPELYGLNPLRLKNGGIVDIFNAWTPITIEHTQIQGISSPAPGQTFNTRSNARFVDITDATGASLWTIDNAHYSHDTTTGVVTINSDFNGFTAPFVLTDSIGEEALVTDVGDNTLQLASELEGTYPVGAIVASVQSLGNLQARVGPVRDMTAWTNNWEQDGTNATGSLNVVDYPIEVNNADATNEDWVLIFSSATTFRCVGRRVGQIATGDTLNDFLPINPRTQQPYFAIRSGAFGGGWNVGEAIRFATYAASKPVMLLRSVASGHSQISTDRAVIAFRGNES
ncbi:hypothetical protein [Shewanella algae]|uniref:hypothetical protein n=1 Tax=Shewanella algae TaxID=38313 RepID=UPI001AAD9711|nr:hypothetical protein [Shewanella algae]MBO2611232.1 hypothetical protein [Shewanella algae]MBO2695543.1 hypothetical protein [Shewanella algae]